MANEAILDLPQVFSLNGTEQVPLVANLSGTQVTVRAASSLVSSGVLGVANPTAQVGLTAVNGTAITALRSDGAPALSQAIVPTWTGIHTWGSGTYTATPAGIPVTNSLIKGLPVASADQDPVEVIQKTSTYGGVSQGLNSALYVSFRKNTNASGAYATGGLFETIDLLGGTGNFVEGLRAGGTLTSGITAASAYGLVSTAIAGSAASPATFSAFLVGHESEVVHFNTDAPIPSSFNPNNFSTSFLATNSVVAGAKKTDAAYMVNGFSVAPFRTGFFVMSGGADYAAFLSKAATVIGLDLSAGTQSTAAIAIPNATPISAYNAASSSLLDVLKVDNSNRLVLATGATSIRTPVGMTIDGGANIGYTAQDGAVTTFFSTSTLFTHSSVMGNTTNHNLGFITNNALRGYWDTSGSLNVGVNGISQGAVNVSGTTSGSVSIKVQAAAGTYNFNLPTTAGTAGFALTSAGGGSSAMTWTAIPGRLISVQTFTTSGTYTPTPGVTTVYVKVIGGGGAGGGAANSNNGFSKLTVGGGGGAGALAEGWLSPGATETVTVGAAGAGASGTTGGSGGTSSFGTFLVSTGGVGGTSAAEATSVNAPGGSGGTSSQSGCTAYVLGTGQPGVTGFGATAASAFILNTGAGGSTTVGGGGIGGIGSGVGAAGTGYGSGGAGGLSINNSGAVAGGAGAAGIVIVYEY